MRPTIGGISFSVSCRQQQRPIPSLFRAANNRGQFLFCSMRPTTGRNLFADIYESFPLVKHLHSLKLWVDSKNNLLLILALIRTFFFQWNSGHPVITISHSDCVNYTRIRWVVRKVLHFLVSVITTLWIHKPSSFTERLVQHLDYKYETGNILTHFFYLATCVTWSNLRWSRVFSLCNIRWQAER